MVKTNILPLILQNAFVVSAARGENENEKKFEHENGRADRELLLNLMGGTGATNAADTFAGDLVSRGSVRGHVAALSSQQPDVGINWAVMAFNWAVLSTDKILSLVSWRLFSFLNKDFSLQIMHQVALCLHTATACNEFEKMHVLLGIISDIPNNLLVNNRQMWDFQASAASPVSYTACHIWCLFRMVRVVCHASCLICCLCVSYNVCSICCLSHTLLSLLCVSCLPFRRVWPWHLFQPSTCSYTK